MRKKIQDEPFTKAKKREFKNRPRMKMSGRSLLLKNRHGGKKIASK